MIKLFVDFEQVSLHHLEAYALLGQLVGEGLHQKEEQVVAQDQGVCG